MKSLYYIFHFLSICNCIFLNPNDGITQGLDSNSNSKWVNYNRSKESPFYKADRKWDRQFITKQNDTLQSEFNYSVYRDTGPILYEYSIVNGKKNGLSIG